MSNLDNVVLHPNQDEYEEMFERIDREADGEVYVNEVLDFLQSMASDLDQTKDVQDLLKKYREKGDRILYFPEFMEMIDAVREAGWTRFKPVKGQPIAEKDMRKIFKLVDLDKDGSISNLELKLSLKYLGKRYGMSDMTPWQEAMRAADVNGDGSLSFLEFQDAIKMAEEAVLAIIAAKEEE